MVCSIAGTSLCTVGTPVRTQMRHQQSRLLITCSLCPRSRSWICRSLPKPSNRLIWMSRDELPLWLLGNIQVCSQPALNDLLRPLNQPTQIVGRKTLQLSKIEGHPPIRSMQEKGQNPPTHHSNHNTTGLTFPFASSSCTRLFCHFVNQPYNNHHHHHRLLLYCSSCARMMPLERPWVYLAKNR